MIANRASMMGQVMNHRICANKAPLLDAGGSVARIGHKGAVLCIATIAMLGIATWDQARAQCTSTATGLVFPGLSNATLLNATTSGISSTAGAVLGAINTMDTAFLAQGSAFVTSPSSKNPDQLFSGAWFRSVGGEAKTSSTGTVNGAQVFNIN